MYHFFLCFATIRYIAIYFFADSELVAPDADPSMYSELWSLVSLYTESAQDVIEQSDSLSLGQHKLLTQGYAGIMKICKEHHLRGLLNFAQTVLTKYR